MTTKKLTKLLALYLPYILLGLATTNFGEAWRLAEGKELGDKIMSITTSGNGTRSFRTRWAVGLICSTEACRPVAPMVPAHRASTIRFLRKP